MYNLRKLELDKILEILVDYTYSEHAKQKVLELQPFDNIKTVVDENNKTNSALSLILRFGNPTFQNINEPSEYLQIAKAGGILSVKNIFNSATILRQARVLKEYYRQSSEYTLIEPLFEQMSVHQSLEKHIQQVFVTEDDISDSASDELFAIRRKISNINSKVKDTLDKLIRSTTYQKALQDNIVTQRDGRYVVPVKAEHKTTIQGLVHDTSSSGATLFIEPMSVVELNNEIRILKIKEKDEIDRILSAISDMCADIADDINVNFNALVDINIYFAKANLAIDMNAVMPQIVDSGIVKLNKARHPLIDKELVVPISLEIGNDYTSLIITGPNTGGKTVTLKTVGLLTLMTMCGILIPVSEDSIISTFDNILVDIGDEQSIAHNLSTFSAHMTNVVSILDMADNRSLVLVDELGSGTDPIEGAGIATAILETLKNKGCIVMATTHYAELKVYALDTDGVLNASCEFDVKSLRPTYKLLIGTPGRSNAFEISRKLGLPEHVLELAAKNVASDKKSFEDVIDQLESSRQKFEEKAIQLDIEKQELVMLKKKISDNNQDAIQQKEEIIEKAKQQASVMVDRVRADSALIMEELDKLRKQKDQLDFSQKTSQMRSNIKGQINKLYDAANPVLERNNDNYVLPRKLKKGDIVTLVDIDKTGTVIETADNKGFVLVQSGIIKTRTSLSNVRLVENPTKVSFKGKTTRTVKSNKNKNVSAELNLRGMNAEEAIMELEIFLNDSLLANVGTISVIHGKGTGVLRTAVHDYFKRSKHIKSYRLGLYGEGENGVTIAELK